MVETGRLYLEPLNAKQLRLWVQNLKSLERQLNCSYQAEPMEGMFKKIVKGQIKKVEKDKAFYMFHSFWFMIRKTDRVVIGALDFKDKPDENGEVEIGYGLGKKFEGNGYMTEAVQALTEWCLAQDGVRHVIAETETDNYPSHNILKRCGYKQVHIGNTLWWKR